MSKYIPFTTEQKERAASVDLEEFLRRRGEKLITSGREADGSAALLGGMVEPLTAADGDAVVAGKAFVPAG